MNGKRLYFLLLLFIITVNIIVMAHGPSDVKVEKVSSPAEDGLFLKQEEVEKILSEKKSLAALFGLSSLLIAAMVLLGFLIDMMLLSFKFAGSRLDIRTYELPVIRWSVWDVARVVILFLFFGHIFIIIESFLADIFPIVREDNFRMVFNSSILDAMAIIFIMHFTLGQYKEKLVSLGLSTRNFLKNIFYGITGYVAAMPALAMALAISAAVAHLVKYMPEKQPVVELFLKEKSAPFLVYTGIFASIFGPIIEELFFRGFMYSAFKKAAGIFWAMIITSAVFALLHAHIIGFLPIMILGFLLAYLYEKTGTLVAPITVHMAHNLSMVFLVFLTKQLQA